MTGKRTSVAIPIFQAVLSVLVVGLALTLQLPQPVERGGFTPIPIRFSAVARAERVCFSGDCPCFDEPYRTQCFADRERGRREAEQRANIKTTWIGYRAARADLGNTGYAFARLPLRYTFLNCMGEVHVAYAIEPKKLEVSGYVFERKTIPTEGRPLREISSINLRAKVVYGSDPHILHYLKDGNAAEALGFGCFTGQTQKIGTVAKLVGPGAKREAVVAYLGRLSVIDAFVDPAQPLRNTALETGNRAEPLAQRPAAPIVPEDSAALRSLNAGLAREAHAKNAAFARSQEEHRAAMAKHQADVAALNARNAARMAEYARQKGAADAAQAAYEAQLKSMRR